MNEEKRKADCPAWLPVGLLIVAVAMTAVIVLVLQR